MKTFVLGVLFYSHTAKTLSHSISFSYRLDVFVQSARWIAVFGPFA
jgi:hypothetical protein